LTALKRHFSAGDDYEEEEEDEEEEEASKGDENFASLSRLSCRPTEQRLL